MSVFDRYYETMPRPQLEQLQLERLQSLLVRLRRNVRRYREQIADVPVESLAPVLAAIRDRAAELGMRFLWYTPTEYCRLSPVELELGPRRCNAGEYSICIEPNGDVLPCQSYYAPVGNILRDPWRPIWESALFLEFRRRVVEPRSAGLPERCWQCPDLPLCAGGCKLERMKEAR